MITITNRDTLKAAYADEVNIVDITEKHETISGRVYPYTRIHLIDERQGHDFTLDVIESKKKINELIKEAKHRKKNPIEKQGPPPPEDP